MTFLELATAIDKAEEESAIALKVVSQKADTIKELKAEHDKQMEDALQSLDHLTAEYNKRRAICESLFAQLQSKLPSTREPVAKVDPTTAQLKDLYQSGMKFRSSLG